VPPEPPTTDVPPQARPLVVTLALEDGAQQRFDRERRALFPPGRTAVGAHVTLFHALPGAERARVQSDLRSAARRAPFEVAVTGPASLGRGVAYRLASEDLGALHADLRAAWLAWLTPQDRQPFRPHVTVQNKVSPEEARATLERLAAGFTAYDVWACGLALWRYDGGPWTLLAREPFAGG
jgi:2'-5' RNA ligase